MSPNPFHPALETGLAVLDNDLLAEKASALGHTEQSAVKALAALKSWQGGDAAVRAALLDAAAHAVWCYFVQRELTGLRDQRAIIRDLGVPGEVLVRLGAVPKRK